MQKKKKKNVTFNQVYLLSYQLNLHERMKFLLLFLRDKVLTGHLSVHPSAEDIATMRNDALVRAVFILPVAGHDCRIRAAVANACESVAMRRD